MVPISNIKVTNPIVILIYYLTYWRRGALMATRHCSPVSLEHFGPGQGGNGVVGAIMIFLNVFIVISWIANNWTSVFWTDLGFSCCTRNGRQSYIWGHWSWKIKNMENYRYDFESCVSSIGRDNKGQRVERRFYSSAVWQTTNSLSKVLQAFDSKTSTIFCIKGEITLN